MSADLREIRAALAAAAEAADEAMADMVPRNWRGLMAILDYTYPEDIFPTGPDREDRDPGPRIVSLLRRVDAAEAEIGRLRAELDGRARPVFVAEVGPWPVEQGAAHTHRWGLVAPGSDSRSHCQRCGVLR